VSHHRALGMYHQYSGAPPVRRGGTTGTRRGKRSASSGQTAVYPLCATEQLEIECVLFINDNASRIMASVAGPLAHVVSVSCADTLRDIRARNGCGVFEPDAKSKHLPNAKDHLSGLCIDLYNGHSYTTTTGVLHVEPAGSYQSQLHLHDGERRLTMDPGYSRMTYLTSRKSISHPFAYIIGLPYMLQPVFTAW
jgi:hypothetical protein